MSITLPRAGIAVLLATAGSLLLASATPALAVDSTLTIIQLQDLHGNLLPHAGVIQNPDGTERYVTQGGGVAKAKTLVDQIRASNPNNLLLAVGDSTQGSAEVLFTVGDAIMPAMNAFGIDAFTPGNWDFGYGPAVYRNRFVTSCPTVPPSPLCPPLPANIRVMANAFDGPGVTKASFETVAINVYNDATSAPLPPALHHTRIHNPYKLFTKNGVKVAVIGITASIVPQQPDVFNIGLRFTAGTEELPGIIDEVKGLGASIIIVQSELGLSQNVQIAREFVDIDVVLSAHTHELTNGALLADAEAVTATTPGASLSNEESQRLKKGAAIVVESGEDLYLGRLDLMISDGKIKDFRWHAIPVDDNVAEDAAMKALADAAEEPFIAGTDGQVVRHTFMPGGYCTPPSAPANCGDTTVRGLQLTEDLNTVVGSTEVLLERHNVLEDIMNNFIADAIRDTTDPVVAAHTAWGGVDISMTNGFRFDVPILSVNEVGVGQSFVDGRTPGEITLRDLFYYFPISPATAVAEFSGQSIQTSLEDVLAAVFDPNPYRQKGGWYVGLSNMTQELDLNNRPFSSSSGRIVSTKIAGADLDPSGRYVFASCYGHGDPVDRVCRTGGGAGHLFFELANADDYASDISLVPAVNSDHIVQGPVIKQVAPDRYLHPVHMMRRYLDKIGTITEAEFGTGRIRTVDSTKLSSDPNYFVDPPVSIADATLVQPIQGAGPGFLDRIIKLFR